MELTIQCPAGAPLAGLKSRFQRYIFDLNRAAEELGAAQGQPGGRIPILRAAKGRAVVETVAWDSSEPMRFTTVSISFADRCLIPCSGLSVHLGTSRYDLDPIGSELAMVAGWWQRLNATEPASVRILFSSDSALEDGPIVIPPQSWEDWLDPNKDVRNLQRGGPSSWRKNKVA